MNFEVNPWKIFTSLLCFILFLLCANIFGIISNLYLEHDYVFGLVPLFDFDTEQNIPTLYSSLTLLVASILLFVIAVMHKKNGSSFFSWIGLAAIFLFLSVDEMALIHEHLQPPIHNFSNTTELLLHSWIVPYGILVFVFIVSYIRFLLHLPFNIMMLFVASGAIFVTGAIGFEILGGRYGFLYGEHNLIYSFFYTCEEFLEMFGVDLFIYSLLLYIVRKFNFFSFTLVK